MRNVTEVRIFLRRFASDAADVVRSGTTNLTAILGKVVGLIGPGTAAGEEINQYVPELGVSTNQQMDDSDIQVSGLLTGFGPEAQRDVDAIEKGFVAFTRIYARGRVQGKEEGLKEGFDAGVKDGRAQLAAELNALDVNWEEVGIELSVNGTFILTGGQ